MGPAHNERHPVRSEIEIDIGCSPEEARAFLVPRPRLGATSPVSPTGSSAAIGVAGKDRQRRVDRVRRSEEAHYVGSGG